MAKDKPEKEKPTRGSANNATTVSVEMIVAYKEIMIAWIKAGESNFLQGYSSNIALTDFLYHAGFLSKQGYDDNRLQTKIFAGLTDIQSIVGTLFGANSPLAPVLKSRVDQSNEAAKYKREHPDEDDDFGAAISQLATQALAGAIEAAAVLA